MLLAGVLGAGVLVLAAPAAAHHSAAVFFNRDLLVEIRGVITEWSFTNPHPIMRIAVKGENGETVEWMAQFTNVLNMRRLGITTETFAAGMEVTIKGPRSVAPGTHSVNPEQVFLPDGTEIRAAPGQPRDLPRGIY